MGASRLALEELLESGRLTSGKAGAALLTGLGARLSRASDLARPASPIAPTASSASADPLERLLGGLPKGKLVEIVGRRTSGRYSLALAALASVTSAGEPAALVDAGDHFDPQAAAAAGVELERVLWVRPAKLKGALASAEMLLATGFPLVVTDLGIAPRGSHYLPDAAWVRLSRAAQSQGACLLVVTPWRMTSIAAEAVVTADVGRPVWLGSGKSPRLLDGISSRVHLEKWGRATPGTSAGVLLRAGEGIDVLPPLPAGDTSAALALRLPQREAPPSFQSGDSSRCELESPIGASSDIASTRSPDRPIPLIDHPITRSPDHPIFPPVPPRPCA